jgi:hypothetical protein
MVVVGATAVPTAGAAKGSTTGGETVSLLIALRDSGRPKRARFKPDIHCTGAGVLRRCTGKIGNNLVWAAPLKSRGPVLGALVRKTSVK